MTITSIQASKFVQDISSIIKSDINFIDTEGIIIASTDITRIGKLHKASLEALNKLATIEVLEDSDNIKSGINTPIIISQKVYGVLGITGDPKELRKYTEIASKLIETFIKSLIYERLDFSQRQKHRDYLDNLLFKQSTQLSCQIIDQFNIVNQDLIVYKIDVRHLLEYQKILDCIKFIEMGFKKKTIIAVINDSIFGITNTKYTKFDSVKAIFDVIEKELDIKISIVFGKSVSDISKIDVSYQSVLSFDTHNLEKINYFDDLKLDAIALGMSSELTAVIVNPYEGILSFDDREFILRYIKLNGSISIIANEMFIHKNTVQNRVIMIKEVTGLDLRDRFDMIELFFIAKCLNFKKGVFDEKY